METNMKIIQSKKIQTLHHLLDIESLNKETIEYLLDSAQRFLDNYVIPNQTLTKLSGKLIVNLFFEPSTRTRHSFEIAAKRLGAITLTPDTNRLSVLKGEILIDTIHTFESMGTQVFIVRHPDNHKPHFIASELVGNSSVINAGDGTHQHPTQALLDLLTIKQHKPNLPSLAVAIVGDIEHSRVARSVVLGLKTLGVSKINLIAPDGFMPMDIDQWGVEAYPQLIDGLKDVDVVMALRIQKERIEETILPNLQQYFTEFGLTEEKLKVAKPDVIVMHPGPINRGVEIASNVADGPHSVILQQVQNGVAMRMAVLDLLVKS